MARVESLTKQTTEFGSECLKGNMEHTDVSVQMMVAICVGIQEEG